MPVAVVHVVRYVDHVRVALALQVPSLAMAGDIVQRAALTLNQVLQQPVAQTAPKL